MIITRRHIESPFEINTEEWNAIREMLMTVKNILDKYKPDGYNIGWNVGKDAGQNMDHTHLHVIARYKDEPLAGKGIRYAFKQPENKRKTTS